MLPTPGASRYLAVAIVELRSRGPIPQLAATRSRLHLPDDFEFKYHGSKLKQRDAFFACLRDLDFAVKAAVIEKDAGLIGWPQLDGEERLVDLAVRLLLRNSSTTPLNGVLVVDGAKSRHLRMLRSRLSGAHRAGAMAGSFDKIVNGDSAREDGLQLADMVVGAIRDSVANQRTQWFSTFSRKVRDLWRIE